MKNKPISSGEEYTFEPKDTGTFFIIWPRILAGLEVLATFPPWHISLVYLKVQQFVDKKQFVEPSPEFDWSGLEWSGLEWSGSPQGRDTRQRPFVYAICGNKNMARGCNMCIGPNCILAKNSYELRVACYRWKSCACHTNFSKFEPSSQFSIGSVVSFVVRSFGRCTFTVALLSHFVV